MSNNKIKALKNEIESLKSQWPAHSVPPMMLKRLDELEEELEKAMSRKEDMDKNHSEPETHT